MSDLSFQNAGHFDFRPNIRVLYGNGILSQVGQVVRSIPATRVLMVTDPGIRSAGHVDKVIGYMQQDGITLHVFDGVEENPTTKHVERGTAFANECGLIDLILGMGGGSAMDCAKGINFLLTNGGKMEDYWGFGKARKRMLPTIGIPTTAGTGSEAQSYALIEQKVSKRKMACGDLKARFHTVLLDPELTVSAPASVTAVSGIDAVTHAVESYVTSVRTPFSQMYAREAWRLLEQSFETVLENPSDLSARGNMLLGSHLAGMAIEASMLGAAHACANPLTSQYGVAHGAAVGLMLPHVVQWNSGVVESLYAELLQVAGIAKGKTPAHARLRKRITEMLNSGKLHSRLTEFGVKEQRIPELARDAADQWTGKFNPRPLTEKDFVELYRNAL